VPAASEGAVSLGNLTGGGAVSEVSKISEEKIILASEKLEKGKEVQQTEKLLDAFVARRLDVKFIAFEMGSGEVETGSDSGAKSMERKTKRQ
jgi:hypothetical protein